MEFILSSQAVRQIEAIFDSWSRRQRTTWQQPFYRPPFSAGGSDNCYKVAVKNDETYVHGLYERTSCADPEVWELLIAFTEGHCPYSEGDPDGAGCDTTGYEPGSGWTETTASGYDAAWENSAATDPPAAPPSGEWVWAGYPDGDFMQYAWIAVDCHWIAYGALVEVVIE